MDLKNKLEGFFKISEYFNIDTVYNEAGFQHELGCYLRQNNNKVKFEKSVQEYWHIPKEWAGKYDPTIEHNKIDNIENKTMKKNIDLLVDDKIAIELKRPKKTDPENVEFWSFLEDIKFLEEMVYSNKCKIDKGYFIVVFDKSKKSLYSGEQGISKHKIYGVFRNQKNNKYFINLEKNTELQHPFNHNNTKTRKHIPITLKDTYRVYWNIDETQELGYLLVEVSK